MIFITGGAFTSRAAEFLASVDNPRLEKPFDPDSERMLSAQKISETGATNLGRAKRVKLRRRAIVMYFFEEDFLGKVR